MKICYWILNVVLLPLISIYVCYLNVNAGQWDDSILFLLLSVFSVGNYLKSYGEPLERARDQFFQDQFIHEALMRCEHLEEEINSLKIQLDNKSVENK